MMTFEVSYNVAKLNNYHDQDNFERIDTASFLQLDSHYHGESELIELRYESIY